MYFLESMPRNIKDNSRGGDDQRVFDLETIQKTFIRPINAVICFAGITNQSNKAMNKPMKIVACLKQW